MCGIIGVVGGGPAVPILLGGLRRLEYRGYDSAGLALAGDGALLVRRSVGKVAALADKVAGDPSEGPVGRWSSGIAHTRWATHGAPTEANAHPHLDRSGRIAVVHNGIIENYRALRARLESSGHVFASETDTEVLARLIGDRHQGDLKSAVIGALREVVGAYGIAVLCADDPGRLIVARKGSPLSVGVAAGKVLVASDPAALVAHTRQVIHLDDGDVAELTADSVEVSGLDHRPRHRSPDELPAEVAVAEKDGHEHFMHKEMHEQPESVRNALRGRVDLVNGDSVLAGLGRGEDGEDAAVRRAVLLGCGTSLHACMVGEFAFEELAQLPAEAEQAAEFRYRNPLVGPEDLVIAVSQSGETADTLAAVKEARNRGARVRGLVNVVGSAIARQTGRGVYLHVGPEVSVASTKAFTGQVSVLLLMALRLGRSRRLSRERGREIAKEIDRIPSMIERVLELESAAIRAAERMAESEHAFFLGRGPMHPVALEGALKLKEISYVHAEGYHAAELKHGPIALLTEGTPVVVIANRSPVREKTLSNAEECRARGAGIIALVTEGQESVPGAWGELRIPDCDPLVATVPAAVALQLLAYHVARLRGCPIDQPRNLAKSVTVE